jgi:UDP-N-acetylmuramoyl-tripeptide--D-alanyl-D-alanine ligase
VCLNWAQIIKAKLRIPQALVQPHAALINNIGTAHLEGFGGRDGIAKAKGEIFSGLVTGGVAIINADDEVCRVSQNIMC